jgi:hypothetical protein
MISTTSKQPYNYYTTKLKNFAIKSKQIEFNVVAESKRGNLWELNPGTIFDFIAQGLCMVIAHKRRPNIYKPGDYHHSLIVCSIGNPSVQSEIQLSWLMVETYEIVGQVKNLEQYITSK